MNKRSVAGRGVVLCGILCLLLFMTNAASAVESKAPSLVLDGVPFEIKASSLTPGSVISVEVTREGQRIFETEATAGEDGTAAFTDLKVESGGHYSYSVTEGQERSSGSFRSIPGWLSLLPPLVAVFLAIVFRQVVLALFAGIWMGAFFVYDWNVLSGFLRALDVYLVNAYSDSDHVYIICFSLLLGGMIGIISRSGGALGLIKLLSRLAKSSTSSQFATWLMGLLVFFDDYSNSLFVGSAMRPLCDKYRVSREKLAFIIDTTAAPVANIALISTWIGFEISLIGEGFEKIGWTQDPYITFLYSIPYRFYPILAIFTVMWLIALKRDFGPMYKAELRSRTTGKVMEDEADPLGYYESAELMPDPGAPKQWSLAIIPIFVAVFGIMLSMWITGYNSISQNAGTMPTGVTLFREVLSNADSYRSLLWGSAFGCGVAAILTLLTRALDLKKTVQSFITGMRSMFLAIVILGLAWSIGEVCADLQTANYLVHFLGPHLSPYWIPALTTIISALISFSVGSSWATMSIVMPLVIPLIYFRTIDMGPDTQWFFMIATISSVLAGATFGDHASPISDTTILSSIFAGSDHIDHVRTQVPYALLAAVVGVLLGDIPTAYGFPAWLSLILGVAVIGGAIYWIGKPVPEYRAEDEPDESPVAAKVASS